HGAMATAVQALELPALAVAEFQVQPLHAVRAGIVLGDAVDGRQATAHGDEGPAARRPGPGRAIMAGWRLTMVQFYTTRPVGVRATSRCCGIRARRCANTMQARARTPCRCCRYPTATARG